MKFKDAPDYTPDSRKLHYQYQNSNGKLFGVIIKHDFNSPWKFKLTREEFPEKIFKQLKLLREIQIGDITFDEKVFITGDEPSLKDIFISFPEFKSVIIEILEAGFTIKVSPQGIELTSITNEEIRLLTETKAGPYIDQLAMLITKVKEANIIPRTRDQLWIFQLFMFLIAFAGIAAFRYKLVVDISKTVQLRDDLSLIGMIVGAFLSPLPVIMWRRIRKLHSRSHYELLVLMIVSCISFVMIGNVAIREINRSFDKSGGIDGIAKFHHKKISTTRGGPVYLIFFSLKPPPEASLISSPRNLKIRVTQYEYFATAANSFVRVKYHPGYFNQTWYEYGDIEEK